MIICVTVAVGVIPTLSLKSQPLFLSIMITNRTPKPNTIITHAVQNARPLTFYESIVYRYHDGKLERTRLAPVTWSCFLFMDQPDTDLEASLNVPHLFLWGKLLSSCSGGWTLWTKQISLCCDGQKSNSDIVKGAMWLLFSWHWALIKVQKRQTW